MTKEQIQQFTLRITQSNRSGIIVVMFEALEVYLKEIGENKDNYEAFKTSVRNAQNVIYGLSDALDFKYEISQGLYEIYDFLIRALEMVIIKKDTTEFPRLLKIVTSMRETFEKVHEQDESPVLMQNTQQVYAGLTYGRDSLNETSGSNEGSGGRGYLV